MPSLDEWLALEHTNETPYMVRLFERRPDWLPTGRLEGEVLVWFDSDWPGLPLYLDYEEFTVGWNVAHDHLLWRMGYHRPIDEIVDAAIEGVEGVLDGCLLRLYVETRAGGWRTAGFVSTSEAEKTIAEQEADGGVVTLNRWPGTIVYRT